MIRDHLVHIWKGLPGKTARLGEQGYVPAIETLRQHRAMLRAHRDHKTWLAQHL